MLDRKKLAGDAAAKALWARKQLGAPLENAICPIDSAESLGLDVRLVDLPSMEGMYVAGKQPRIILSCLRPQGRRAFTCAHEIGHHRFAHGQQFDELKANKTKRRIADPKEFIADCFAAYFLMPKATVDYGLASRGFSCNSLTAIQVYYLASWLGVGYKTLVGHLLYGLGAIGKNHAEQLRKSTAQSLRSEITGRRVETHLHVVDLAWRGRAVDCEVGDFIVMPTGTESEGAILGPATPINMQLLVEVLRPGIARISSTTSSWATFVRASKQLYVGRGCYRFEEDIQE